MPMTTAIRWFLRTGTFLTILAVLGDAAFADDALAAASEEFHDLSPWAMFMAADVVVKLVMAILLLASVATWTICLAKTLELNKSHRAMEADIDGLRSARRWDDIAVAQLQSAASRGMADAATRELALSAEVQETDRLESRLDSTLARKQAGIARDFLSGTGILATIGSTAPFIGLFGTVWGIMNSFIGIAKAQTTNLAIVAPGIAEALLATALGLVAAIPAVMIYNHLARRINKLKAMTTEISGILGRVVSRDPETALGASLPGRALQSTTEARS